MTREFDDRNMAKSRAVCEAMAEAHAAGRRELSERERQILDMWPRFEDGEPVWFGDAAADDQGGTLSVVHICISEGMSCVADGKLIGADRPTGEPFKRPAPTDSWVRLEEDAAKGVCEYAGAQRKPGTIDAHACCGCRFDADGDGTTCEKQMARDIVRRAKRLAGVE